MEPMPKTLSFRQRLKQGDTLGLLQIPLPPRR
jgi:hypothetical protein